MWVSHLRRRSFLLHVVVVDIGLFISLLVKEEILVFSKHLVFDLIHIVNVDVVLANTSSLAMTKVKVECVIHAVVLFTKYFVCFVSEECANVCLRIKIDQFLQPVNSEGSKDIDNWLVVNDCSLEGVSDANDLIVKVSCDVFVEEGQAVDAQVAEDYHCIFNKFVQNRVNVFFLLLDESLLVQEGSLNQPLVGLIFLFKSLQPSLVDLFEVLNSLFLGLLDG